MKLYVDESVSVALATILAQYGIDCLTARDAGYLGQSDEFQLRVATETERTIFTHDTRDFIHPGEHMARCGPSSQWYPPVSFHAPSPMSPAFSNFSTPTAPHQLRGPDHLASPGLISRR